MSKWKCHFPQLPKLSAKQKRFLLVLHDYFDYLRGFLSIHTFWAQSLRKEGGLSDTTCWTRNLIFMYSRNRFTNPRKCSAVLMFPGTASETPSIIFLTNGYSKINCTLNREKMTSSNVYRMVLSQSLQSKWNWKYRYQQNSPFQIVTYLFQ